jgi:hypothetical protein
MRFGQNNEILALAFAPRGRDGDAIFLVDGMTEFAGEEFLRL